MEGTTPCCFCCCWPWGQHLAEPEYRLELLAREVQSWVPRVAAHKSGCNVGPALQGAQQAVTKVVGVAESSQGRQVDLLCLHSALTVLTARFSPGKEHSRLLLLGCGSSIPAAHKSQRRRSTVSCFSSHFTLVIDPPCKVRSLAPPLGGGEQSSCGSAQCSCRPLLADLCFPDHCYWDHC